MASPGRNEPCPCGSGRKFKHCCIHLRIGPTVEYTQADRSIALAKLSRFSQRSEFAEALDLAGEIFWARPLEFASPEQRSELAADQVALAALQSWYHFDFDWFDDPNQTICRLFLDWPGADLSTSERTWLERMNRSALRLYEIEDVRADEGLTLRDLAADTVVDVAERMATRQLARWDLLAARVVPGPEGIPVLEGVPYLYPRMARDEIRSELDRALRQARREYPALDDTGLFKVIGARFHHLWVEHVVLNQPPIITTVDGDPLVLAKVVFDVTGGTDIAPTLRSHPDIVDDGGDRFLWVEASSARILGWIVPGSGRVTLEVTSEARANRGKDFLEAVLGDAIRYRATRLETVEQALAYRPAKTQPGRRQPPPAEEADIVTGFLEQHYRSWPDHPLPALGGRTPRRAARLKTVRPRLIALLKDLENGMERERRDGRPAIDLDWLWTELGLERPGTDRGEPTGLP